MRIAVVASPVTPLVPTQVGGAQAFICDLAVGLARRGHDVTLHCAEGSEVPGVTLATVPAPHDSAAALVMPAGPAPPPARGVDAAISAMFEAINAARVDVISQHAFDAAAFVHAEGMPVLHTLHLPPIVPAVVDRAQRVPRARLATVSQSCLAGWRTAGVEVGQVLPNGVTDEVVATAAPQRVALVAGRLSPEKGIDHALAAADRAGIPARVAGAQYDPDYGLELGGAEYVGAVPRGALRRMMASSAVTICAVRWEEPFGMVAAEAQMAGCPVAAYRRGALGEVVEDGVSGILASPDDIDDLAHAIRRCLGLDRASVRSSAQRRLGLEAALDRYEAALEKAAA